MRSWFRFLATSIVALCATMAQAQSLYKPTVQLSMGAYTSRYVAPLILSVTLPRNDAAFDRITLTAISLSGQFVNLMYHRQGGWLDERVCGYNKQQMLQYCGLAPGSNILLTNQITNADFADLDLVITYMVGKGTTVVEQGYLFQCIRFGGFPLCLSL